MAEKEYIEREKLNDMLEDFCVNESFYDALQTIPSADVSPIVRCKDCIYSSFVSHCSKYECGRLEDILFFSDDFCSYGKRKENYNG